MVSEARPIETGAGKVTEVDFRNSNSRAVAPADMAYGSGRDIEVAGQYDDYAWQGAGDGGAPRRNRLVTALISLVAIAGFVAVIWFAYQWGLERGYREEVPVVRAAAGPIKLKPENPGGLVVPNQDKLVLNQLTADPVEPQVERLLSEPEAPKVPQVADVPAVEAGTAQSAVAAAGALESVTTPAQDAETAAAGATSTDDSAAEATPPAATLGEIATAAGGTTAETTPGASADGTASGAASEAAATTSDEPLIVTPRRRPAVPASATQTAAAAASTTATAGSAASGSASSGAASGGSASGGATSGGGSASGGATGGETAVPAASTQIAAVEKGDYVIQLASVTSSGAAKSEWSRLQKVFPVLLGDMNLAVQTATVKGTEYHRIQTGPFPSRATAVDLCLQLKAKKQPCLVQKR